MSKTSADKLPQYVYRTAFGVYRFRRNVPKDIMEVSGRKLWYKVFGKDYKEALQSYSTALLEFDSFVSAYRNEAPVRETILEVVKAEFGEDAMRMLARGQVDENLEFALMDLSDKVEGSVSEEVSARIYGASLPPVETTLSGVLDRYREYKATGNADKDRLMLNLIKRTKRACEEVLGTTAVNYADVAKITRKDVNRLVVQPLPLTGLALSALALPVVAPFGRWAGSSPSASRQTWP